MLLAGEIGGGGDCVYVRRRGRDIGRSVDYCEDV
jgi:hypothetical protein